jgi:hypothetical protein
VLRLFGILSQDHWLPGFNFGVEEWFEGDRYETLAICCTLALARAAFEVAIAEKPTNILPVFVVFGASTQVVPWSNKVVIAAAPSFDFADFSWPPRDAHAFYPGGRG